MGKTMAVIGGDLRQIHLARLLLEDGRDVVTWGLEHGGGPCAVPMTEALERDVLIFPLPVCRGGQLNLPLGEARPEPERLWSRIAFHRLLLGGMTGELSGRLLKDYGLTMLDYFDREELQVANAAITAEGALQRLMEETEDTLLGSTVLVVGFGRIGKLLARRLQALGAHVSVSARRSDDLAWAQALGYRALHTGQLEGELGRFDMICNTVPARVLPGRLLAQTDSACLLLELASEPGGMDPEAARVLKRRLIRAPGLPGLAAPRAAAKAVRDTLYHILEERGESI